MTQQEKWRLNRIKRRREQKRKLIAHLGGKCVICGYDKYDGALEFHHVDPTLKEFQISHRQGAAWAKVVMEAEKCVLLCSNCHREVEAGIVEL